MITFGDENGLKTKIDRLIGEPGGETHKSVDDESIDKITEKAAEKAAEKLQNRQLR